MSLQKKLGAERLKSAVTKTPSARRPRCTPTSTPSAPLSIARPMIFCQRNVRTPVGAPPRTTWGCASSCVCSLWRPASVSTTNWCCPRPRTTRAAEEVDPDHTRSSLSSPPRRRPHCHHPQRAQCATVRGGRLPRSKARPVIVPVSDDYAVLGLQTTIWVACSRFVILWSMISK
jgi:hypothetical protein